MCSTGTKTRSPPALGTGQAEELEVAVQAKVGCWKAEAGAKRGVDRDRGARRQLGAIEGKLVDRGQGDALGIHERRQTIEVAGGEDHPLATGKRALHVAADCLRSPHQARRRLPAEIDRLRLGHAVEVDRGAESRLQVAERNQARAQPARKLTVVRLAGDQLLGLHTMAFRLRAHPSRLDHQHHRRRLKVVEERGGLIAEVWVEGLHAGEVAGLGEMGDVLVPLLRHLGQAVGEVEGAEPLERSGDLGLAVGKLSCRQQLHLFEPGDRCLGSDLEAADRLHFAAEELDPNRT
jgi:hypothetical protein